MSNMSRIIAHKTENYTTISNYILKDKNVSLKAKGIFITIMSLPPTWNININGLCSIVKEGKSAIQSALNELIKLGYCKRTQIKNKNHFAGYLYELYEVPNENDTDNENIDTKNTYPENQDTEIKDTENRPLLNTDVLNTVSIKQRKNNNILPKFQNFESYNQYLESLDKNSNEYYLLLNIQNKYPNITKLENQMTFENAKNLINTYSKEDIIEVLNSMENTKGLSKKYISVYLTLNKWLQNHIKFNKGTKNEKIKSDYEKRRSLDLDEVKRNYEKLYGSE